MYVDTQDIKRLNVYVYVYREEEYEEEMGPSASGRYSTQHKFR